MSSQTAEEEGLTATVELPSQLTIGQLTAAVTQLTGIPCTAAMIYNYERKGLIEVCERTEGGFRLFNLKDVERVAAIKRWQADGLSLDEIEQELERCNGQFDDIEVTFAVVEDRRTQILEAALQLFPQKGYEATTLLDIAEKAGISSAAIYQYFESKEELFLAIIDLFSFRSLLERIGGMLQKQEMASGEDLFRALVEIARVILDGHMQHREIHRMFLLEARIFPEIGRKYRRRLLAPMEELLEQFIAEPIEEGILRDVNPKLAVHAFFGMLFNGQVIQLFLQGEGVIPLSEADQVEELVDIYLGGVLQQ